MASKGHYGENLLQNYFGSHTAIYGIIQDIPLMKEDGIKITVIKSIQKDQETVNEAEKNQQVAVSLPKVTVGRQINENDILYSAVPEDDFRKLKEFKKYLTEEEKGILKEIAGIMRKKNPMWGI